MEILKAVNYPNLVEAHFDIKSFDLIINGGTKYDDHGKGYCAFINSVVTMMFRKYLVEHGAKLKEKLIDVPEEVDRHVAELKLAFLGKKIDRLTPEQEAYLNQSL